MIIFGTTTRALLTHIKVRVQTLRQSALPWNDNVDSHETEHERNIYFYE